MYEHLEDLHPLAKQLLSGLRPLSSSEAAAIEQNFPSLPRSYLQFLKERGYGSIRESGNHFDFIRFLEAPLDAARDYYGDDQIYLDGPYEPGAAGPVLMFGTDSTGAAFGFDLGDSMRIINVDNSRCVTRLQLSFFDFVRGLLVCYPQFPNSYSSGSWEDSGGTRHELEA